MEDDFEFRVEPEAGLSLYGLYDGHGGAAVSAHCAQHLLAHVQAFLARNPTGAADAPGGRLGRAALGKALSYAFGKTDREVIPHSTTLPPAHPLSVSLSFKTRHTACPISTG
jgi:serine/threonine protein phosphatase PrpC